MMLSQTADVKLEIALTVPLPPLNSRPTNHAESSRMERPGLRIPGPTRSSTLLASLLLMQTGARGHRSASSRYRCCSDCCCSSSCYCRCCCFCCCCYYDCHWFSFQLLWSSSLLPWSSFVLPCSLLSFQLLWLLSFWSSSSRCYTRVCCSRSCGCGHSSALLADRHHFLCHSSARFR